MANGPPCTKAAEPSVVCTIFGDIASFNKTVIGSLYGFMVSWKGFFVILGTYFFYLMLSFGAEARLKKVITRDYGDSCEVVDEDDMMGVFPLIIVVVYLIVVVVRFFSV